ncbi:MAG TPA: hypothetical protein DC048_13325 [Planctomycetaceae bacterium]|nr:hypothetical protein [Planctomycetaceae bacterium]
MITVNLTTDQFAALERIVRDAREQESRMAYASPWPANSHHEANVRLMDTIEDTLRDAVAARIAEVRSTRFTAEEVRWIAEGMRQQANQ